MVVNPNLKMIIGNHYGRSYRGSQRVKTFHSFHSHHSILSTGNERSFDVLVLYLSFYFKPPHICAL